MEQFFDLRLIEIVGIFKNGITIIYAELQHNIVSVYFTAVNRLATTAQFSVIYGISLHMVHTKWPWFMTKRSTR